jgi:pyruvate formate lyase activating enzyme
MIFDIKRFAVHDGPGVRTTVFFKGCPLKCAWCHNPESISRNIECMPRERRVGEVLIADCEQVGYDISVDELLAEILKDRVFMEESGGGVTFSGGEPLMQPEFLLQILMRCQDAGLHTVVDTSGYASLHVLKQIAPFTNLFLYDLKLMDDNLHQRFTGVSNSIILKNFEWLLETSHQVRVRVPIVPDVTATHDNLQRIADYLSGHGFPFDKVDLLPFHTTAGHKYERLHLNNEFAGIPSVSKEVIANIRMQHFHITSGKQ